MLEPALSKIDDFGTDHKRNRICSQSHKASLISGKQKQFKLRAKNNWNSGKSYFNGFVLAAFPQKIYIGFISN